jgi:hypothetical protein
VRRLRPLLLLLGAAAIGLVVGLAAVTLGDDVRGIDRSVDGRALRQHTSISPRLHLFAEPVTAEAEFLVDPARIDPSTVRLVARFAPYTQISAQRSQTAAGDLARIRYRFRLTCMAAACVPSTDKGEIQFESATVAYVTRDGGDALGGTVRPLATRDIVGWPTFEVASRLPVDVQRARWRAELTKLPEPSFRFSPAVLGAALVGSSALLALLGGALVAGQLRGRARRAAPVEEALRVTPLERALAAVLAMSANGAGPEQRKSLERLARELTADGRSELAGRARRLAWSPRPAVRAEVEALAADVRAVIEEER